MTVAEFNPSQRKSKKVLARPWALVYSYFSRHAGLAQLVARHLAKVEVAGSNPVARSMNCRRSTNRSAVFLLRVRPCASCQGSAIAASLGLPSSQCREVAWSPYRYPPQCQEVV